jgi:hypothetical protein
MTSINQSINQSTKTQKWKQTSGAGTAYPSGAAEFTLVFSGVGVTRN